MLRHESEKQDAELVALQTLIDQRRAEVFLMLMRLRRSSARAWHAIEAREWLYKVPLTEEVARDRGLIEACFFQPFQGVVTTWRVS